MDRYTQNANESLHAQCSQETVELYQLSVDSELQKIEQKILSENDWMDECRSHVPPISKPLHKYNKRGKGVYTLHGQTVRCI